MIKNKQTELNPEEFVKLTSEKNLKIKPNNELTSLLKRHMNTTEHTLDPETTNKGPKNNRNLKKKL